MSIFITSPPSERERELGGGGESSRQTALKSQQERQREAHNPFNQRGEGVISEETTTSLEYQHRACAIGRRGICKKKKKRDINYTKVFNKDRRERMRGSEGGEGCWMFGGSRGGVFIGTAQGRRPTDSIPLGDAFCITRANV